MAAPSVHSTASNGGGCARPIGIGCLVLLCLPALSIGAFVIFMVGVVLFSVFAGLFGAGLGLLGAGVGLSSMALFPPFAALGIDVPATLWMVLLGALSLGLVIFALVYALIYWMRHSAAPRARFWVIMLVLWLLSLVGMGLCCHRAVRDAGSVTEFKARCAEIEQVFEQVPDTFDRWMESEGTHSYYYEYTRDADGNEYEYEEKH